MKTLTNTQRNLLKTIEIFRDVQVSRLRDEIAKGTFSHTPNSRPSEWVSVVSFCRAFSATKPATIRALVKAGELLQRSTDGFGPEILVTRSASAEALEAAREQAERDAEDAHRDRFQD